MFDRSIFEILTTFFLTIIASLSCAGSSKDKSDPTSNRLKGKQKLPLPTKNNNQTRAMMETKRIDIPGGPNPAANGGASKEKMAKEPSKKKAEQPDQKAPGDGKDRVKTEIHDKTLLDGENNRLVLQAANLPKLDRTVSENIHTPAVHDRANRIAIDRLIIDPKHTHYGGNIDMLTDKEKKNKLAQIEHDLENNKTEKTTDTSKKSKNQRVKIREDKCVLFETNEVPTDDEEEEPVPEGI